MFAVISYFLIAVTFGGLVDEINGNTDSTWEAVEYPPEIMSKELMLSKIMRDWEPLPEGGVRGSIVGADASFDARTKWGSLILPVRDQGSCGSCWAFAIAEMTGDRYGIEGGSSTVFSPQFLVSCDREEGACQGGVMDRTLNFVKNTGIATEACLPYRSGSGSVPTCTGTCANGSQLVGIRATSYYYNSYSSMQSDLQNNGPFTVTFNVYEDLYSYRSGVYQRTSASGKLAGGHAVLLVGWGVTGNVPYWIVQNSWETQWGINGFFYIYRGNNECGIEGNAYAAKYA